MHNSDLTLCAVVILQLVELLGGSGNRTGTNFVTHAGGASKLIETRGPLGFTAKFSKYLLLHQMGSAVGFYP